MSIRDSFRPNAPCPCGKNKRAKDCCMTKKREWYKEPADINPKGLPSGISNPGCYLKDQKNCCDKISKEHYISQTVLKDKEFNGTVAISGLKWIPENTYKRMTTPNLVANILCKRHNEALSDLDNVAGRFIRLIGDIDKDFNNDKPKSSFSLFAGEDIERWMIKTLLNLVYAKHIQGPTNVELWKRLLFSENLMPSGWGLYIEVQEQIYHNSFFEFTAIIREDTKEVVGAYALFNNFKFILFLNNMKIDKSKLIHRPRTLIFSQNGIQKIIELSWKSTTHQSYVEFTRAGKYDGDAPNIPVLPII